MNSNYFKTKESRTELIRNDAHSSTKEEVDRQNIFEIGEDASVDFKSVEDVRHYFQSVHPSKAQVLVEAFLKIAKNEQMISDDKKEILLAFASQANFDKTAIPDFVFMQESGLSDAQQEEIVDILLQTGTTPKVSDSEQIQYFISYTMREKVDKAWGEWVLQHPPTETLLNPHFIPLINTDAPATERMLRKIDVDVSVTPKKIRKADAPVSEKKPRKNASTSVANKITKKTMLVDPERGASVAEELSRELRNDPVAFKYMNSIKKAPSDNDIDYYKMILMLSKVTQDRQVEIANKHLNLNELSDEERKKLAKLSLKDWVSDLYDTVKHYADPEVTSSYLPTTYDNAAGLRCAAYRIYLVSYGQINLSIKEKEHQTKHLIKYRKLLRDEAKNQHKNSLYEVFAQAATKDNKEARNTYLDAIKKNGIKHADKDNYYMRPIDHMKWSAHEPVSRLSYVFAPESAKRYMKNAAQLLKDESKSYKKKNKAVLKKNVTSAKDSPPADTVKLIENRTIHSSKTMGPTAFTNSRVDHAVTYMPRVVGEDAAKEIARKLTKGLIPLTVQHVIPGMFHLNANAAYAEYPADSNSSHGYSRVPVINLAVYNMLVHGAGKEQLEFYLDQSLVQFGFDTNEVYKLAVAADDEEESVRE
jgi:hypothetical protein